ncbi:unnamed protein product, partial [Closterium sp. NIES-64]
MQSLVGARVSELMVALVLAGRCFPLALLLPPPSLRHTPEAPHSSCPKLPFLFPCTPPCPASFIPHVSTPQALLPARIPLFLLNLCPLHECSQQPARTLHFSPPTCCPPPPRQVVQALLHEGRPMEAERLVETALSRNLPKPMRKQLQSAIAGERSVPPLAISSVPPLAISSVPPLAISSVPPLAISSVAPLAISSVPPLAISSVPPLAISSVPPLAISSVPPLAISSVPPLAISY